MDNSGIHDKAREIWTADAVGLLGRRLGCRTGAD